MRFSEIKISQKEFQKINITVILIYVTFHFLVVTILTKTAIEISDNRLLISPKISTLCQKGIEIRQSLAAKNMIPDFHWKFIAELYLVKINKSENFSKEEFLVKFGIEESQFLEENKIYKLERSSIEIDLSKETEENFKIKKESQLNKKSYIMEIIKAFESEDKLSENSALELLLTKSDMFNEGVNIGKSYIEKITKHLLLRPNSSENVKLYVKANSKIISKYPEEFLE